MRKEIYRFYHQLSLAVIITDWDFWNDLRRVRDCAVSVDFLTACVVAKIAWR